MKGEERTLFSDEQMRNIVLAILEGSQEPMTEEQIQEVVDELELRRIDGLMVEMVARGKLAVKWDGKELRFRTMEATE